MSEFLRRRKQPDGWKIATTAATAVSMVTAAAAISLAVNARSELAELRVSVKEKHAIVVAGFDSLEQKQAAMTDAAVKLMNKTADLAMDANERSRSAELKADRAGR